MREKVLEMEKLEKVFEGLMEMKGEWNEELKKKELVIEREREWVIEGLSEVFEGLMSEGEKGLVIEGLGELVKRLVAIKGEWENELREKGSLIDELEGWMGELMEMRKD